MASSSSAASTGGTGESGADGSSDGTTSGSGTSTGAVPHCQVEVVQSLQVSTERFGTLTLVSGHPDLILLGSRGWTLAEGEMPVVERFRETSEDLMAGRFGPGGGWAYAERGAGLVTVLPLDDADAAFETIIETMPSSIVGDLDADGLDDLVIRESDGVFRLWRADGDGGFVMSAVSEPSELGSLGFAPATDWAPAAVLVAQDDSGVAGFELVDDVIEKTYTVEAGFVWSVQGVQPLSEAGRSILVAREGGILLDPIEGYVGFLEGQEGGWTRRGVDLGFPLFTAPGALDLDDDAVLDAVAATLGPTLRGGCSEGDTLVPCLEAPLSGTPESLSVTEDGRVFVATEDDGLWVYQLGACV